MFSVRPTWRCGVRVYERSRLKALRSGPIAALEVLLRSVPGPLRPRSTPSPRPPSVARSWRPLEDHHGWHLGRERHGHRQADRRAAPAATRRPEAATGIRFVSLDCSYCGPDQFGHPARFGCATGPQRQTGPGETPLCGPGKIWASNAVWPGRRPRCRPQENEHDRTDARGASAASCAEPLFLSVHYEGDVRTTTSWALSLAPPLDIAALAGSLRATSYNRGILPRCRRTRTRRASALDLDLAALPLFNQDLEQAGLPATVTNLRQRVRDADGLLIATPEYNHTIPGVMGNAIDLAVTTGPDSRSATSQLRSWVRPVAVARVRAQAALPLGPCPRLSWTARWSRSITSTNWRPGPETLSTQRRDKAWPPGHRASHAVRTARP